MIVDEKAPPPEPDRLGDAPHPRTTPRVLGHGAAEAEFLAAFNDGRLHHAWMMSGPRGVGKATLAWRLARFLLATPHHDDGLFAAPPPDSLDIAPDNPVARRMAALAEPRLFLLRRPWNEKTEKLASQITIDETRKLKGFFQLSAADGGRRAVIIDAADEMNTAAANAILKVLEEPPAHTTLFLVTHQPARLLPTIRSRCRMLRLSGLDPDDLIAALDQAGVTSTAPEVLHGLAQGSVGDAIALEHAGGPALYGQMVGLLATLPEMDRRAAQELAQDAASPERFELILTLFDRMLARLSLTGARNRPPAEIVPGEAETLMRLSPDLAAGRRWAARAEGLTARARRGRAVNLDPSLLILDMCLALARSP
ncbi:MAG: DNA polymerase III subunit delta' [Pseudomonadota bacterium]